MRCPGCQAECEPAACRCARCGTPLLIAEEPAPAPLDRAVDLDRRLRCHAPQPRGAPAAQWPAQPHLRIRTPLWDLGTAPQLGSTPPATTDATLVAEHGVGAVALADTPTGWQLGELLDPAELAALELGFEELQRQPAAPEVLAKDDALPRAGFPAQGDAAVAAVEGGRGAAPTSPDIAERPPVAAAASPAPTARARRVVTPRVARAVAALVDLALVAAAAAPALAPVLAGRGAPTLLSARALACAGFVALLGFVYGALGTALMAATLGQRLMGLRLSMDDGGRPGPGRSVARALLAVVGTAALGIGPAVGLFTPSGRSLHDRALGTRLVAAP